MGDAWGWLPRHIALLENKKLIGAVPQYIKYNSYGELVFDWAWADAYQRSGLRYYPKLVIGVPYSPVTGRRLLVHPEADTEQTSKALGSSGVYPSGHRLTPHQWASRLPVNAD